MIIFDVRAVISLLNKQLVQGSCSIKQLKQYLYFQFNLHEYQNSVGMDELRGDTRNLHSKLCVRTVVNSIYRKPYVLLKLI